MTRLRIWFVTATVLAFGAGAAASLVALRMLEPPEPPRRPGDADAYVERFEREIGIESDAQRRAIHEYYDLYWQDLQALSAEIAAQHPEELDELDAVFRKRVAQILNAEQRRRWNELSGRLAGEGGPPDTDDTRDDHDRPAGGEK